MLSLSTLFSGWLTYVHWHLKSDIYEVVLYLQPWTLNVCPSCSGVFHKGVTAPRKRQHWDPAWRRQTLMASVRGVFCPFTQLLPGHHGASLGKGWADQQVFAFIALMCSVGPSCGLEVSC